MTVLFVLVGIAVIVGVSMAAAGSLGQLPAAEPDRRPEGGSPAFDVVLRGYRMDEVDATIEDLRAQVAELQSALRAERS